MAPGEPGDVVISGLFNRAMVLLNYRLGDRAVLATEPCPCGRTLPVLARLEGRRSEIVELADGREISSLTMEGMFRVVLCQTVQAQVEQIAPGQLRWRLVPFGGADREALESELLGRARDVLGADTKVTVELVDAIPRTAQGKFVRTVKAPAG